MSFTSQLLGFTKRNSLIKYRNKFQLFSEILFPITVLLFITVGNYTFTDEIYNEAFFLPEDFPPQVLNSTQSLYLYIIPDNVQTRHIGDFISDQNANRLKVAFIKYCNTAEQMKHEYIHDNQGQKYNPQSFGIEFADHNFPFDYTIFKSWSIELFFKNNVKLFKHSFICNKESTDILNKYTECAGNRYVYDGLSALKYYTDLAIKSVYTNSTYTMPSFKIQNMPKHSHVHDNNMFDGLASYYFSLFFVISLMTFTSNIVAEREKNIKELMSAMAMKESAFWLSWILAYMLPLSVFNILAALLMLAIRLFETINIALVFFVLLQLFSLTVISFGMLFSTFFKRSKSAGALCGVLYIITSLFYYTVYIPRKFEFKIPVLIQWLLSLFFPCAFAFGIDQALYAQRVRGHDDFPLNLLLTRFNSDYMTVLECVLMLSLDSIIYIVLTIYSEKIRRLDDNTLKAFVFFVYPSYWTSRKKSRVYSMTNELFRTSESMEMDQEVQIDYEPVPSNFIPAITLKSVEKTYYSVLSKKARLAIDNLDLTVYLSQVTAILGHSNAGKSTLLKILTGLTDICAGSVNVLGHDVSKKSDLEALRQITGVCPQQDCLYDFLTCSEHIELYARLKGVAGHKVKNKVAELLEALGLVEEANNLTSGLRSGVKRRLCLALALIGDPKVLLLDEPTAGMDQSSRRCVWQLLQNIKQDKVILLMTSFMDEADLLADRKGMLINGRLKCIGTTTFIKNKFGIGYHLNCVISSSLGFENDALTALVRGIVVDAKFKRIEGRDICYSLPLDAASNFQKLFENLEKNAPSIGIESYGLSITSLEAVYMNLSENEIEFKEACFGGKRKKSIKPRLNTENTQVKLKFLKFIPLDIYALLKLRHTLLKRNKISVTYRFLIPLISMILAVIIPGLIEADYNYDPKNLPRINLETNNYNTPSTALAIINNTPNRIDDFLKQHLTNINNKFIYKDSVMSLLENSTVGGLILNQWININESDIILLYNDSALLSMPYMLTLLTNFHSSVENLPFINTTLSTLPKIVENNYKVFDAETLVSLIILGVGLVMPAVSFAGEIVHEKELKCENQLRLIGCGYLKYWGVNIGFFFLQNIFIPFSVFLVIFLIPSIDIVPDAFKLIEAKIVLGATTSLFILAILMMTMCLTFIFDKKENAFNVITVFYIILIIIPFIAVDLASIGEMTQVSDSIHLIVTVLNPPYGLIGSFYKIFKIYSFEMFLNSVSEDPSRTKIDPKYYFEFKRFFIPISLASALLGIFFYSLLLYYLDQRHQGINIFTKIFCKKQLYEIKKNEDIIIDEDSDVNDERAKIRSAHFNLNNSLILKEVRKTYPVKTRAKTDDNTAIRNLSLSINKGEIFGLLGPKRSGKTTVLKLITNEEWPEKGQIISDNVGINIETLSQFRDQIGTCPQINSFWDDLTLYEHLELYASIKKTAEADVHQKCREIVKSLGIEEHANTYAKDLSIDTKRKLAFALSIFVGQKLVLLDEPTSGMDPKSKRQFWNTMKQILSSNRQLSAVLTTNSMEEAEALCDRIGVLIRGELKFIGTSQYLKEKFGMAYMLEAKINMNMQGLFLAFIEQLTMQQASLVESFSNKYLIHIPRDCIKSLSQIFERLEKAKSEDIIVEYNFSQCTFEQMYLQFVKAQRN